MTVSNIAQLVSGAVKPSPEEASEFLRAWYADAPDKWLSSICRMIPPNRGLLNLTAPWSELVGAIDEFGLDELIWDERGVRDLYFSTGFLNKVPPKHKRGGISDASMSVGVWLDLDVNKPGCFTDHDTALDFVMSLAIRPTILANSGTGGVHAYWKLDQFVNIADGRNLCERWYHYALREAGGVKIDKLCTPDRIMRLPGAIRWQKDPSEPVTVCKLLDTSGPRITSAQIVAATQAAWEPVERDRVSRRTRVADTWEGIDFGSLGNSRWDELQKAIGIPEHYNETHTWDEILIPMGWTEMGTDHDGRRLWMRPGGTRKSAATDYVDPDTGEVSQAMSLFSDSPDTALQLVKDSDIPLTKYRVAVELYMPGDEEGFVRGYIKHLKETDD